MKGLVPGRMYVNRVGIWGTVGNPAVGALPMKIPIDRSSRQVIRIRSILVSELLTITTGPKQFWALSWEDQEETGAVTTTLTTSSMFKQVLEGTSIITWGVIPLASTGPVNTGLDVDFYCYNSPTFMFVGDSSGSSQYTTVVNLGFEIKTVTKDQYEALQVSQRPHRSR